MGINVKSVIEAALFIAGNEGVSQEKLKNLSRLSWNDFNSVMEEMSFEYEKNNQRGIVLRKIGNNYKLLTKDILGKIISSSFGIKQNISLNKSMLETLAIIAYNEPCTRATVSDLRKQDSIQIIEKLIEIGLVKEAGRSNSVGKPYVYQITPKFYDLFGIDSIKDLPEIVIPDETLQKLDEEEIEQPKANFFDSNREE